MDKKYYKITLGNQELLITSHRDFAVYMFKFIRELTEYKTDMQIVVGIGTEFKTVILCPILQLVIKIYLKHLTNEKKYDIFTL